MIPWRRGIVGEERGPSLRAGRDRAKEQKNQQKDEESTVHARDGEFSTMR
jgi:hypothetical protein